MKRNRVSQLTGALLLAGLLLLVPPAESSKTPVDIYEAVCLVTPATQWVADNTLYVRGQHNQSVFYDPVTFEEVGTNSVIGNVNVDLQTGELDYFGTFSGIYLVESDTGTFDGTWNGHESLEAGFFGHAIGRGTEELAGRKIKLSLRGVDPSEVPPELLAILSQPPWTDCLVGIFRDTGFVHGRGGPDNEDSDSDD